MLSDESVFEFLASPENFAVALDVARYVEKLKKLLHEKFWGMFNNKMRRDLESLGLSQSWKYNIVLRPNAYLKSWGLNAIVPNIPKENKTSYLYMFFGQTSIEANYKLFWGVSWNSKPTGFQHPSLTKLIDILDRRKMNQQWSTSVRWGYYDNQIYAPDFLLKMYRSPEELVDEITGDVMQLFSEIQPLMETINKDMH